MSNTITNVQIEESLLDRDEGNILQDMERAPPLTNVESGSSLVHTKIEFKFLPLN